MDFNIAVNQTLILFIIMSIGYVAGKKGIISGDVQQSLSSILLKIGLPFLALSSANSEYTPDALPNIINIAIITTISYVVIIALSTLTAKILKYKDGEKTVFISLIVFANVGFMGYPVAFAFFGEIGVFYASIVNLVFTLLLWTYGILMFNSHGKIEIKKLFNIGTISSILTIVLFMFQIKLPYVIQSAFELTGKMSVPMSCLIIGAMISGVEFGKLFKNTKVFIVSFIRLFLIPVIVAWILRFFNFNEMVISICVLMSAMPSAATNAIFAKEYNAEPEFASIGVFMTTLLSIVSLPAIVYILTNFIL